jgi:hypothetical protein
MSFVQDGYEIFANFIDVETIRRIKEATARACQRFRDGDAYCLRGSVALGDYTRSRPYRNPGVSAATVDREPYIIGNLAGLGINFRRFLSQKSLWNLAAQLLATHPDDVAYHFSSVNRKPAMIGPAVSWHRDYANEYVSTIGPFFLRLMIPLDPMSAVNAVVGIVPGSHAIGDEDAARSNDTETKNASAIYPNLFPGDVVAIHSKLVHGGGPNRSHCDRELMVIQFGRLSASMLHFSAESEYLTLCVRSEMASAPDHPSA